MRLQFTIAIFGLCLLTASACATRDEDIVVDRLLDAPTGDAAPMAPPATPKAARRYRVVVDAGHGGIDHGASSHDGYYEKDLALQFSREVRKSLEFAAARRALPIDVVLTREDDRSLALAERASHANDRDAHAFVSLHGNSSPFATARGFEVYFLNERGTDAAAEALAAKENGAEGAEASASMAEAMIADVLRSRHVEESGVLAEAVHTSLSKAGTAKSRGVRQAPFRVLSRTSMPAILVEVGFLSHRAESRRLGDAVYRRKLADAIAVGILNFLVRRVPVG